MASSVFGAFAHQTLGDDPCALERRMRVHFVIQKQVQRTFERSFRAGRTGADGQCLFAKLLDHLKRLREFCNVNTPARPNVTRPCGSIPGGTEASSFSATLRSPFHLIANSDFNAREPNDSGAASIPRSKILSAASKFRVAI